MTRRRGTVSLAAVFIALMLAVLLSVVLNAGRLTGRKLESRNAADAAAQTAGVQLARGMNQITTVNHQCGEWHAVAVLAHAYGGPELEAGGDAHEPPPVEPDASAVARGRSGAAIRDARRTLLGVLAESLRRHPTADELAVRRAVRGEWAELNRLEAVARVELVPLARLCRDTLVPELAAHAVRVAARTPGRAEAAVAGLGRDAGVEVALAAADDQRLALAVVPERPAGWERSQLVRAAVPWVRYWRRPTLATAAARLPLSRFADHYREWTDRYTVELARGTRLLVLKDSDQDGKGREPWVADGRRAAGLFGVTARVRATPPAVLGGSAFGPPPAIRAVAQAMLYNANPQAPDAGPPADWQPAVGFDTLNWAADVRVPEWSAPPEFCPRPRVGPNWRATLVPVGWPDHDTH